MKTMEVYYKGALVSSEHIAEVVADMTDNSQDMVEAAISLHDWINMHLWNENDKLQWEPTTGTIWIYDPDEDERNIDPALFDMNWNEIIDEWFDWYTK